MAGKPFQSKLTPHFDHIATMRRQHKSWPEIVDHLLALGVKTDKGNLYAFFKRHRLRPNALGAETEPVARRHARPAPAAALEKPDLSDFVPPSSEFDEALLPIRPKKMWSIITPTPTPNPIL